MTKRDHIESLLAQRDPKLFMQGGCHVFAEALRSRFGYDSFAIKRGQNYRHVYCKGIQLAVDGSGRRHEDHILDEFVHFEGVGGFSRDMALKFRVPFTMADAMSTDRGLLVDTKFLMEAREFADEHIAAHDDVYKNA
jgi:hypothetical protein